MVRSFGISIVLLLIHRLSATVFKGDPLDPARGKLYRDKILKYGGSREELDSLKVSYMLLVHS
jgi:metallopeptidase MepB